jgi:hypothetical protein
MAEGRTIRFVPISQQIARCGILGKGLGHLAREPVLRGIWSDLEMNNPSAVEVEHNKGVEEPKRRGGDHKHIDRRDVGQVVMQEGPPGRGGNLGTPRHPAPNRGLADLDAELEQFPMDAGAPHNGLALLMRQIKSRISVPILGRPGRRDRHRQ